MVVALAEELVKLGAAKGGLDEDDDLVVLQLIKEAVKLAVLLGLVRLDVVLLEMVVPSTYSRRRRGNGIRKLDTLPSAMRVWAAAHSSTAAKSRSKQIRMLIVFVLDALLFRLCM